jgi:hypothetical protein
MNLEQLKSELARQEKALANPKLAMLLGDKIKSKVETLQKQIAELESNAKQDVKEATEEVKKTEKKVDEADNTSEKKKAEKEVKEAKEDLKEAKEILKDLKDFSEKADKVEKKVSKIKRASSPTKMKKPDGVPAKDEKTVRAFGQTITYKNESDFCKNLITAFKSRKEASKKTGKRKRTKPVFNVITSNVKNVVSKALNSVSKKEIERNPKQFLQKAKSLEKSAIRFLQDFKGILGDDFKKSEITSEFGELEKSINKFVQKYI